MTRVEAQDGECLPDVVQRAIDVADSEQAEVLLIFCGEKIGVLPGADPRDVGATIVAMIDL